MTCRLMIAPRRFILLFFLLGVLAISGLMALRLPTETIDRAFTEGGPVEAASVVFLVLAALTLSGGMVRSGRWERWHLALLAAALALRELDMDKALTEHGILSARLYSGPAPIEQKIAGALVVAGLVWASLRVLRRDLSPWTAALRREKPWAWLLVGAFGLYCVAKALDGAGRKLVPLGIELSDEISRLTSRAEEGMELLAAILILLASLNWRRILT